jgi:biofilm PGA synthesis N-glycosyltransferase PgaC
MSTPLYIRVKVKFVLAFLIAALWLVGSIYVAAPWFEDLSKAIGPWLAGYLIGFIAIIPGFMNAFMLIALFFDQRPSHKQSISYPPVTVLIAAYNEADCIEDTLRSIYAQDYPSEMQIIVINDGSLDKTEKKIKGLNREIDRLKLMSLESNQGKSSALNIGLKHTETDLVISVDADCYLLHNSIRNLVERYFSDPPNTAAVAGEILIRNSRENWITKAQEWDYFLGIAAVKRIQSLFQGTLVAQGAFSLYQKQAIEAVGGWPKTVGEDIVLTWALLKAGYRIGHAEDACAFTTCPNTLRKFIRQRQRWSRGLIEAFKANPSLLFKPRLSTIYIWWNALFPLLDVAYTIGFIPGIILALFGYFWIVGPMTLFLLPAAALLNRVMLHTSAAMLKQQNLTMRSTPFGLVFYMLAYSLLLQPACVWGYITEILSLRKKWGTK